jgi:Zn-dependent M28 family amino/carboxypeptidase
MAWWLQPAAVRLLLTIWLLVSGGAFAQVRYFKLDRDLVESRVKLAQKDNPRRQQALLDEFTDSGCKDLTTQKVSGSKLANVICVLRGDSDEQIVVGAHFDKVEDGMGVIDNWSGASLLPSLLQSLASEKRKHTFIFIGFAEEEKGEIGSNQYVAHLSKPQRKMIAAMINFDTLGLGPSEVWLSHADKDLANKLAAVAKAVQLPLTAMNVEQVGSTDSEQFRESGIPALTIHSLTSQTFPILHSRDDQLKAMHWDDYYNTYQLAAAYLSYLDSALPDAPLPAKK